MKVLAVLNVASKALWGDPDASFRTTRFPLLGWTWSRWPLRKNPSPEARRSLSAMRFESLRSRRRRAAESHPRLQVGASHRTLWFATFAWIVFPDEAHSEIRSEERRVGKEGRS